MHEMASATLESGSLSPNSRAGVGDSGETDRTRKCSRRVDRVTQGILRAMSLESPGVMSLLGRSELELARLSARSMVLEFSLLPRTQRAIGDDGS
jgi:hypothetical protein